MRRWLVCRREQREANCLRGQRDVAPGYAPAADQHSAQFVVAAVADNDDALRRDINTAQVGEGGGCADAVSGNAKPSAHGRHDAARNRDEADTAVCGVRRDERGRVREDSDSVRRVQAGGLAHAVQELRNAASREGGDDAGREGDVANAVVEAVGHDEAARCGDDCALERRGRRWANTM